MYYAKFSRTLARLLVLAAIIVALLPITAPHTAAQTNDADSRPLEGHALDNVIAFTRLAGYVQYFYPGDEAAATDWNRFTVEGMRAVEDAPDTDALIAILHERFAPVAPLLQIYAAGASPDPIPTPDDTNDLHLITWHHIGLQTSPTPSRYTSTRLTKRPNGPAPQEYLDFPAPDTVYSADIGGGVAVTVPLVLWTDDDGTLPHTHYAPEAHWPTDIWSLESRATRLAGIALAWNVLQHSYPYFDVVDVDWLSVLAETLQRAATNTDLHTTIGTLNWMVAQLQDGHGGVMPIASIVDTITPHQHLPFTAAWIEDQVIITYVFPDAEGALQPGDVLLALDGRTVDDLMQEYGATTSAATPQLWQMHTLNSLLWHDPGTVVVLTIRHISGAEKRVHVVAQLSLNNYLAAYEAGIAFEPRPTDPITELEPG
ncbi:MAG: hypothetical protein K8S97_09470, partial [Anaerolineae bacterium]|nr:hypothetical protein [Anaerolineae bacterium]